MSFSEVPNDPGISSGGASPLNLVTAAGSTVLQNKLVGSDANPTFVIKGDGTLQWGLGGANPLEANSLLARSQGGSGGVAIGTGTTSLSLGDTAGGVPRIVFNTGGGGIAIAALGDRFQLSSGYGIQIGNCTLYSGSGVPNNSNGSNGDYYFRQDTPGTANQRIYAKTAGAWVGIL